MAKSTKAKRPRRKTSNLDVEGFLELCNELEQMKLTDYTTRVLGDIKRTAKPVKPVKEGTIIREKDFPYEFRQFKGGKWVKFETPTSIKGLLQALRKA